jgi:hypothetical protein
MLKYAYTDRITSPDGLGEIGEMLYYIRLYQIADKYNFPGLEWAASSGFGSRLEFLLVIHGDGEADGHGKEKASLEDFCDVVKRVYELPNAHPAHPLVKELLKDTAPKPDTLSFKGIRSLKSSVVRAVEEVAEFGRDLFLYTLRKEQTEDRKKAQGVKVKL